MARHLATEGFSVFSWDKSGFGKSKGKKGDYFTQANDAKAALDILLCEHLDIVDPGKISIFGQSAGVFITCLLAKGDSRPVSYILSGGLYSDYYDMMSYNYHRVRDYARQNPENMAWVLEHDLSGFKMGLNLDNMFDAVKRRDPEWIMEYEGTQEVIPLNLNVYNADAEPKHFFKFIDKPALVIHGQEDLNVPVGDAYEVARELRDNGNDAVELVILPGVDHSFQLVPKDMDIRLRERMSLESFKRPILPEYFEHLTLFLKRVLRNEIEVS
jgi:dipeptidyl aminopeptidase/acylaminoacyl peptidase